MFEKGEASNAWHSEVEKNQAWPASSLHPVESIFGRKETFQFEMKLLKGATEHGVFGWIIVYDPNERVS